MDTYHSATDEPQITDDKGDVNKFSHSFGKQLTTETIFPVLRLFFTNGDCWRERVAFYLSRLKQIGELISTQTSYKFYSTSLLFVYDNTKGRVCEKSAWDMRMIDFAQCQFGGTRDDGYMFGVETLTNFFEQLLTTSEK